MTITTTTTTTTKKKKSLVCFSFAAYAKTLIAAMKESNIPVAAGLSDAEFSSAESLLSFSFPPDLRALLREGLPVAAGFPNWRSSSPEQLSLLLALPRLAILRRVSSRTFWSRAWGTRPDHDGLAVETAGRFLRRHSPVLVPIFRNCYVAATPSEAGNPVFCVDGGVDGVRVLSCDIAGFFRDFGFLTVGPVWAAKEARRIEFWSDVAAAREGAWWDGGGVGECMERAMWRLREGGWREEEVREMTAMDGCDRVDRTVAIGREGVTWQWRVKMLSAVLLRAGWSVDDVAYSLGNKDMDLTNDDKDCVVF